MKTEKFTFYYTIYRLDENGEKIEIGNSQPFQHEELKFGKEDVMYDLEDTQDSKDNDLTVATYTNNIGGKIIEAYYFKNKKWQPLEDSDFLNENKFQTIYTSEILDFYPPSAFKPLYKKPKIESWEDIEKNFRAFQDIDNGENTQTFRKYSQFSHWYYWPEEELFAPSKFLGYKDTTIANYDSTGSGGTTQIALAKYFTKLDKNSEEFKRLYRELQQLSKNNFKKELSYKVLNGKGGIYVPKTN